MYYIPKYFKAEELVPPDLFAKYGVDSLYFLDDRITMTLDMLRKYFGAIITVNNWKNGGNFSQRGYRNDPVVGAPFSAHRFGRAADFDIAGLSAAMFRGWSITKVAEPILTYITRIENSTTWNHIDCMGPPRIAGQPIVFFNP